MEREQLIKIIREINSFSKRNELDDMIKISKMINTKMPEYNDFVIESYNILGSLIIKLEQKLDLNDKEYLYYEISEKYIRFLKNDDLKIKQLDRVDRWSIPNIISSLNSDDKKIELLNIIEYNSDKSFIISSLSNDDKKIELLNIIEDNSDKSSIISSLSNDDKKIELLSIMEYDSDKGKIVLSLSNEDKIIKALDSIENDKVKERIISNLSNEDKKIKALDSINDDKVKKNIIFTLTNENKIKALDTVKDDSFKAFMLNAFCDKNDNKLINALIKLDSSGLWTEYRKKYADEEFIKKYIGNFIKGEGYKQKEQEIINILKKMYKKNNAVLKNINFRILDYKYLETLGEDKINLISCYSNIQEKILSLDDKKYKVFLKCINNHIRDSETIEWTTLAGNILLNIDEYNELIDDIDIEGLQDIEKLTSILQDSNEFKIQTIDDLNRYNEIKKEECDKIIGDLESSITEIKEAVVQKIFGHNLKFADSIIDKYGEDIEQIKDKVELKDYIRSLKAIIECKDSSILKSIYNECEEIGITNKILIERSLKSEYGKLFNEDLFMPCEECKIGENMYDAGTDFRMLVTSVGGVFRIEQAIDYKINWNRPALTSQHFCTSYIRNDMMGTVSIPHICYGFNRMADDALMLSSETNINSSLYKDIIVNGDNERYYSPDKLIDKTEDFNELDFRRIQNGEKKQPDYIVVFRENGKIPNIDKAEKASKDWGDLPIVIVDKDKCLESERKKVTAMMEQYTTDKSPELCEQILQKVHNNRVTDKKFCHDIAKQIKKIQRDLQQEDVRTVGMQELQENYKDINAKERKDEAYKIAIIYNKIKEIVNDKEKE